MINNKQHTLSPFVLQTLSISQQKMANILDIIHGKDHQITHRVRQATIYDQNPKQKYLASRYINRKETILPHIPYTYRQRARKTFINFTQSKNKNMPSSQLLINIPVNMSLNVQNNTDTRKTAKKNFFSHSKPQKNRNERSSSQDLLNIEEQVIKLQQEKIQEIMKNYMSKKLRNSKSQIINSKDIYRHQIQSLLNELTPIQNLRQAQNRIKALKRKHKHLYSFDKEYYLKLNQHDMLVLL